MIGGALLKCENMEEFNKLVLAARNNFEKFELALKEKNAQVYDFSNLHKMNKGIFNTLMKYPEKDDIHSVMYHWLRLVKNFMPSEILSGDILQTLWNFRKFSFKPGNIPFRDEIIKAFISDFEIILMNQSPKIAKTLDWLNYLKTDPYQGYELEIKTIIFNWLSLREGPPFMKIEDKPFLKTITEITDALNISNRSRRSKVRS